MFSIRPTTPPPHTPTHTHTCNGCIYTPGTALLHRAVTSTDFTHHFACTCIASSLSDGCKRWLRPALHASPYRTVTLPIRLAVFTFIRRSHSLDPSSMVLYQAVTLARSIQHDSVSGGHTRSIHSAVLTCIGWSHSLNQSSSTHLHQTVKLARSIPQDSPIAGGHTRSVHQPVLTCIGRSHSISPSTSPPLLLTCFGRSHPLSSPISTQIYRAARLTQSVRPYTPVCGGHTR